MKQLKQKLNGFLTKDRNVYCHLLNAVRTTPVAPRNTPRLQVHICHAVFDEEETRFIVVRAHGEQTSDVEGVALVEVDVFVHGGHADIMNPTVFLKYQGRIGAPVFKSLLVPDPVSLAVLRLVRTAVRKAFELEAVPDQVVNC